MIFNIAIDKVLFDALVATGSLEWQKNKKNELIIKSKKLTGVWIREFQKKINEFENENFKLLGN